ncbi:MAG TPA: AI-2E family transporter [Candidatus Choladousia intestinigallinarum]|nr:AI-2E family transporter [Candidatus Choladousia intestinigallinarum]
MKYLLPYVIPFFIAYALVHVLNPVTEKIRTKLPWKKEIIVCVLMALFLGLFTLLFYYLSCMLTEQIRKIATNFDYYYDCFCGIIDQCCYLAERSFGVSTDDVKDFVYSSLDHATEQIRIYIIPGVVNYSVRYLKKLAEAGIFLLMLFVSVVLLMRDYDKMRASLEKYKSYQALHRITQRMWKQGGMYLKAQMILILIITVLCAAGLWVFGNPYFLLLGIVIGLLDALPFVGTGTILVPMAVFLVFRGNYKLAAGYAGLFLLTYVVREYLEPRLIGAKLGVYPFVMVVVVYAGLYLYGPAGVFLGPVTLLTVMEITREIYGGGEKEQ